VPWLGLKTAEALLDALQAEKSPHILWLHPRYLPPRLLLLLPTSIYAALVNPVFCSVTHPAALPNIPSEQLSRKFDFHNLLAVSLPVHISSNIRLHKTDSTPGGIMSKPDLTPVHFFSHGSTMMLGEESTSATYWKKCGDEALAHGIKGVIMMGAHWDCLDDEIEVAMNPDPQKSPIAYVHPSKYVDYKLNPDLATGERCIEMLKQEGFNVKGNAKFDWIHDTFLVLSMSFPPPCLVPIAFLIMLPCPHQT